MYVDTYVYTWRSVIFSLFRMKTLTTLSFWRVEKIWILRVDHIDKSMGIVTLMTETLTKINPNRSLKILQVWNSQESKLIRFILRFEFYPQNTSLTVCIQEKQTDKVIIAATRSLESAHRYKLCCLFIMNQ